MEQPSPIFIRVWACVVGCLGLIFLWLIGHRSSDPVVLQRYSVGGAVLLAGIGVVLVAVVLLKRWLYRYRLALALICISTVGGLISAEAVLRVVDPLGLSYFDEIASFQMDRIPDDVRGFRHRTSWRSIYQGVEVSLNEHGLRDDPIQKKPPGEYRLMMLGDSVTFGWGVRREDIFSSLVQRSLLGKGEPALRVINAGFPGYNTVQELAVFEEIRDLIEPDAVVLTYVMNDVEPRANHADIIGAYGLEGKALPDMAVALLQRSWLVRLLVYWRNYAWIDASGRASDQEIVRLRAGQGWTESLAALERLAEHCAAHRLPLLVIFFRFQQTPLGDHLLHDVRQAVGASFVVDAGEWFRHEPLQQVVNSRIDAHLNPYGHQIFSTHAVKAIQERILFSALGLVSEEVR